MQDEKLNENPQARNDVPHTEKDWLLQTFVNTINLDETNSQSIGVTILTHGFLVSGVVISGREYFDLISDEITSSKRMQGKDEEIQEVKKHFNEMGIVTYERSKDTDPTFIHLKEARYFHPSRNPIPANNGLLWRGRISEISGFSLGILNPS